MLIVIPENKRDVGLAGLKKLDRNTIQLQKWTDFTNADEQIYFIFGSLSNGFYSIDRQFIVHVLKGRTKSESSKIKRSSRPSSTKTFEEVISKLTSWEINSPVVHRHYGVGRFAGINNSDNRRN